MGFQAARADRKRDRIMKHLTNEMGPIVQMPNPYVPWETEEYRNPLTTQVAQVGSFAEYCRGHFGWEWIEGIREKLAEGFLPVGKTSRVVPAPAVVFLENADILRIDFTRIDRHHFCADAIIVADIGLLQHIGGETVRDSVTQWYRDRFVFEILSGGYNLEEESCRVYCRDDSASGVPLTEYLIPILDEEALEMEAEDMLRLYYPEAFLQPVPVDGKLLAKRMGLTITEAAFPPEQQLMGQAVFQDGSIETVDAEGNRHFRKVRPNMILLNSAGGMNTQQRNDTMIHECIHHYEHDLFAWGQSLYSRDIYGINLPVIEGAFTLEGQSPMYWAETQARLMTYRVKMNRLQTDRKIRELSEALLTRYPSTEYGRHLERVIQQLAVFYRTSKQCARKRMLELGYDSVRGVLDYVNGEYVPAYFSTPGVMDWNQTFTISAKDAFAEYGRNGRFRELVSSGCYVYVEGKFCINKPACVRRSANGKLYLTKAAREAVDRCCLMFEYSSVNSEPRYVDGRLNRELQVRDIRGQLAEVSDNTSEIGSPEDFVREAAWITSVRTQIGGMDFGDALTFLMKERKMTSERLEEASQISIRTISRLRNDREYAVSDSQIVALSVGLHLPPAVSNELMKKAGLCLRNTTKHNIYGMILCAFYMADILTVNAYLTEMGMEPLTQMGKIGG